MSVFLNLCTSPVVQTAGRRSGLGMSFSPATLEIELIQYDIKIDLRMVGKEAVRFLHVAHDRAQRRDLKLSATCRNYEIILNSSWHTFLIY